MNEKVAKRDRWLSVCPFLSFEGLVFVCACDEGELEGVWLFFVGEGEEKRGK